MKTFRCAILLLSLFGCSRKQNDNQAESLKIIDRSIHQISEPPRSELQPKINEKFDSIRKNLTVPNFDWRNAILRIYSIYGLVDGEDSLLNDIIQIKDTSELELKIALNQLSLNLSLVLSGRFRGTQDAWWTARKTKIKENTYEVYMTAALDTLTSAIIIGHFDKQKKMLVMDDSSNYKINFKDGHYTVESKNDKFENVVLRIARPDGAYDYYQLSE